VKWRWMANNIDVLKKFCEWLVSSCTIARRKLTSRATTKFKD
jgi:hypothetical protein